MSKADAPVSLPTHVPHVPIVEYKPAGSSLLSMLNNDHERASSDNKDYANAMPDGMLRKHVNELQVSIGMKPSTSDMLGVDGSIVPLTENELKTCGEVPAVHLRNMGPDGRARLAQVSENPQLIADYLSSGVSPNQLAAMFDMTISGMERWIMERGFDDYYATGRKSSGDIYANRSVAALENIPDILTDVYALAERMQGANPNDTELMESIRMDEWRLGVLKAGSELEIKRAKVLHVGYLNLARSIAPDRYMPKTASSGDVAHGAVQFNINVDGSGHAGTIIEGGQEGEVGNARSLLPGITI